MLETAVQLHEALKLKQACSLNLMRMHHIGVLTFAHCHIAMGLLILHLQYNSDSHSSSGKWFHLEAQQVCIILVHLQLLIVEQLYGFIVEQDINSFACGQVVQLIHFLAHFCGSLQKHSADCELDSNRQNIFLWQPANQSASCEFDSNRQSIFLCQPANYSAEDIQDKNPINKVLFTVRIGSQM